MTTSIVWLIGFLFTIGVIYTNEEWKNQKSTWDKILFIACTWLIWPMFLGCEIGELLRQRQNWKIVIKTPEKDNNEKQV
jgi:hypothetical protein